MAIYHIDSFLPSTGNPPENTYDPTTGIFYSEWDTGDEAHFNWTVPAEYENDQEITLRINDATPETTNKHRWQATVYLLRPGIDDPLNPTIWSVRAADFDPPPTSGQITIRLLQLTQSGKIGGDGGTATDVSPGDALSIVLKRVAPVVGDDDSNKIKNFGMAITFPIANETISTCSGRAGAIMDETYEMFQDNDADFTWLSDAMMLNWINRCYAKIARRGIFTASDTLTFTVGVASYLFREQIPDCIYIKHVHWTNSEIPITRLQSRQDYDKLMLRKPSGTPRFYYIDGNRIRFVPAPDNASETVTIVYAQMPEKLDCVTYVDPITPEEFDDLFVFYCLFRAFLREERDSVKSYRLSRDYWREYDDVRADLMMHYRSPDLTAIPD